MPVRCAAILALACAASAAGQIVEVSGFVGLSHILDNSLGQLPAGGEVRFDSGFRAGARVGLNRGAFVGHEFTYAYERHDLEVDDREQSVAAAHQFFYNVLFHLTPQKVAVRPFVTAGGGVSRFTSGGQGAFSDDRPSIKPGLNYGGGVKLRMGKAVGARFDVREHLFDKPAWADVVGLSGKLWSLEYSAGFSVLF